MRGGTNTGVPDMARIDTEATYFTGTVFDLAGKLSTSAADLDAIRTEQDLDRIYRLRKAAAIRRCGSSLDNLQLAQLAGWA